MSAPVNAPLKSFAALGLSRELVRAAEALGYADPTPVQAAAIPAALAGHDLCVTAQTGSGKTAAFVFSMLQRLDDTDRRGPRHPLVLMLVPTRELAQQVGALVQQVEPYLRAPVKLSVLFGGVSINPQLMALRGGADVVVATPGRLLDVVDQNGLKLSSVCGLVLDEADRLLDAGFADELARVLALLPRPRQNLLFSATFAAPIQGLAQQLLHEPVRIEIDQAANQPTVPAAITQRAIRVDTAQRTLLLRHLIEQGGWSRVLVFVATRYACDHVADKLRRSGMAAEAFHGDASQGARTRVLAAFKAGQLRVLVATDLGARGIDIAQLPVVVNYDLPRSATDHVHRIGRTARAGAEGLALSFVTAATEAHFRLIEKRQVQRVEREQVAGFEPTETAPTGVGTGGVKGKRPSKKDKLRAAQGLG